MPTVRLGVEGSRGSQKFRLIFYANATHFSAQPMCCLTARFRWRQAENDLNRSEPRFARQAVVTRVVMVRPIVAVARSRLWQSTWIVFEECHLNLLGALSRYLSVQ